MCSRDSMPWVVTCSYANVPYVLICSCTSVPYVLARWRANVLCMFTCSPANVLCVLRCSSANVPRYWICFVSRGLYLGRLKMFVSRNLENIQCYWYRSYNQIFLSCFFIFTSFNATPLILFAYFLNWHRLHEFSCKVSCFAFLSRKREGVWDWSDVVDFVAGIDLFEKTFSSGKGGGLLL